MNAPGWLPRSQSGLQCPLITASAIRDISNDRHSRLCRADHGNRCARRAFARPVRADGARRQCGGGFLRQFRPQRGARRQYVGDQDLRPRAPLGLGGGGQDQGAASSVVRLLRRRPAAAEGAHRRRRRQADRSAARLREQRLLVPQSRRRADRGEGRAARCRPTKSPTANGLPFPAALPAPPSAPRRRRCGRAGCRMC